MDLSQLKTYRKEIEAESLFTQPSSTLEDVKYDQAKEISVSLEAEIPEALYKGMKEFIGDNPEWDQYRLISSAMANFLFQNGSQDRAVTERYLNDLFRLSGS